MPKSRERLISQQTGLQVLNQHLLLGSKFENPPQVKGELITQSYPGLEPVNVLDIAATTALQCYAKGVTSMRPRPQHYEIARSTLNAGHDTTRLHHQATFKLTGVSRETVHQILHSTPFYNSEQQSQRYAEAKIGFYLVPSGLDESQKQIFLDAAKYTNQQYQILIEALRPEVENRVRSAYSPSAWNVKNSADRLNTKIDKACQEIARYVLPIAQQTVMDHTLSELQLLRLFRSSLMPHFNNEAKYVVGEMVKVVADADPQFLEELRQPLSNFPQIESEPISQEYVMAQKTEFDSRLAGQNSALVDANSVDHRKILANAVRNVLGLPSSKLTDEEALDHLFNPAKNPLLADIMESGMFDPLTSCLRQTHLTFEILLSHTADSQRQRHRRTPGATPTLEAVYSNLENGNLDYITPMVIKENPVLSNLYHQIMTEIYQNVQNAINSGIPKNQALTLLPNAHSYRVTESGDLFDWIHRLKQRLCFNAQEEIFFISVNQAQQILKLIPEASKILQAPCGIRRFADISPFCPEGTRYCGTRVDLLPLDNYPDYRLI